MTVRQTFQFASVTSVKALQAETSSMVRFARGPKGPSGNFVGSRFNPRKYAP